MNPDKIKYNFSWTQEYKDGLTKKLNDAIGGVGPQDWVEKDIIIPPGVNKLEWIYKKDESVSSGSDCAWIDFLTFPRLSFIKRESVSIVVVAPFTIRLLSSVTSFITLSVPSI